MTNAKTDVAIIGAGPAGLMAAEVLARGGAKVTIYDAMPSVGRKLLMAGRGGLNLTHSEALPESTFIGSSGRVFPIAFKASPLLRAWLRRLNAMDVQLALRHRWTGWN